MDHSQTVSRMPRHYDQIEQDDDDFQMGYEAGYNARAERRTVLGSPAYREGYACGVKQSAARRALSAQSLQRTAVRSMRRRFVRALCLGVLIGLLFGWVLVQSAKADTLADWQQLNELCQGGSSATADKACAQRGAMVKKLRAEGWFQGNHGVWVSPQHVAAFTRVMRFYDAQARANPGVLDSIATGMMTDLRRQVPDAAIFALWNGGAGTILAHTPYAASMLMFGLPYLERTLSGRNDPRFQMVLRP